MRHNIDKYINTDLRTALYSADLAVKATGKPVYILSKNGSDGVYTANLDSTLPGYTVYLPVLPVDKR